MLRSPLSRVLLLLGLAATFVAAPNTYAQVSWKLYDMRDLIGLIPPTTPLVAQPFVERGKSVDELMDRVCTALGIVHAPLLPGVYGVEAEDAQHTQVKGLLEKIRALYAERYEVEIVWFTAPAEEIQSIGDQITPVEPLHRHRLVVTRRTPTPLTLITRHSYVSDLTAVVATSAMAHDPETRSIDGGLQLSILVGAGQEEDNRTSIRLIGDLRRVTMGKISEPMSLPGTSAMAIELPTVDIRSIQTNLLVEYAKLTVVSVLDGFKEGECLVIAASVCKL